MASTVLGKRTRGCDIPNDAIARSTRAKKQAIGKCKSKQEPDLDVIVVARPSEKQFTAKATQPRSIQKPAARTARPPCKRSSTKDIPVEIWQDDHQIAESPSTPRHRDVQVNKALVTPRSRLLLHHKPGTSVTPRTPTRTRTAVYSQARELFSRSSHPGTLIGRDGERDELISFVERHILSSQGGCLYVSGPPGTGKSALLSAVQEQFSSAVDLRIASINCMSIQTASDFKTKLDAELNLPSKIGKADLRTIFARDFDAGDKTQYLLVLDEVDRLVEVSQELLYSIFECSMMAKSRLILVGIANALDLTDRCLPKLRSRGLKPDLLPFMPYSAAQIANILTSKLKALGHARESGLPPFLQPAAIQFCAKKVAAQTGDLRKAFDICRRAIDLVEKETLDADAEQYPSPSKTPLMENMNLSSPPTPRSPSKSPDKLATSLPVYTVASAPRATIAHVARITAQVFSNGASQRLASLNLQQKAVLCSLAALEQRKQAAQQNRTMYDTPSKTDRSAPTVKQLCDVYTLLCKQSEMLHPLSALEFRDVVSGLEAQSLISGANNKAGSFVVPITPSRTPSRKLKVGFASMPTGDERRVASVASRKELESSLQGAGAELLKDILDGHC